MRVYAPRSACLPACLLACMHVPVSSSLRRQLWAADACRGCSLSQLTTLLLLPQFTFPCHSSCCCFIYTITSSLHCKVSTHIQLVGTDGAVKTSIKQHPPAHHSTSCSPWPDSYAPSFLGLTLDADVPKLSSVLDSHLTRLMHTLVDNFVWPSRLPSVRLLVSWSLS